MRGQVPGLRALPFCLLICLAAAQAWGLSDSDPPTGPKTARDAGWVFAETSVSKLSPEDRSRLLGARLPDDYEARLREVQSRRPVYAPLDLPSRFDWTDSAAVGPVRQQLCGDCWAQASVAAMECALRMHDGDTTQLSVQQVVDCNYGNSNCGGGWTEDTYNLFRVVGTVYETCYPYVGADGSCGLDSCEVVATLDTWEYIDTMVVSLKTHLMTSGPLAVGMTVYSDFYFYGGGCYEHDDTLSVNHAVLLVGWDDSKCGGEGAWHIKNSWGKDWGEVGYAWLKYGTCRIGEGASIIYYTPRGPTRLSYHSNVIDDSSGDGDSLPDPGETVVLRLSIKNGGWVTATGVTVTIATTTPGVTLIDSTAAFPDILPGGIEESESPHFSFSVDPGVLCGLRIGFTVSADCDQGLSTDGFGVPVGDTWIVFGDDCEADLGWSRAQSDDDATSGRWRRANPTGSFLDSILVQPELDHTPGTAKKCFVTRNIFRKLDPDAADVDGGKTTLTSPALDLSGYASARVRYWRWYSNDTGGGPDDTLRLDASADSGETWTNVDTDAESRRAWMPFEINLGDHVDLSDRVLLRFVVSDYGQESTVEAAVDDIEITGCPWSVDTLPPLVTVTTPNGGEEIIEGSEFELRWEAGDDYGVRQIVGYASYDSGATYPDTIGTVGGFDSVMTWHVPSGEHPACKIGIEVVDRGYNTAFDESDSTFSIVPDLSSVPGGTARPLADQPELLKNVSNPFSASTQIMFSVPRRMRVRLCIYDVLGRLVDEVKRGEVERGIHSVRWDGKSAEGSIAAGTYFVRLEAGATVKTSKVTIAR
jgi:hypothetical protein